MDRSSQVPVFVDSSLGTHLAIEVSPDTNAGDFKRYLKKEHLNCFPNLGEIDVNKLMVKRRSFFYHLPDSFPIKYAFQGQQGKWLIHMEACSRGCSNRSGPSECLTSQMKNRTSGNRDVTDLLMYKNTMIDKTKRGKTKKLPRQKSVLWVTLRTIHLWGRMKRKRRMKDHFLCSVVGGEPQSGSDRADAAEVTEPVASRAESIPKEWKSSTVMENPRETLSEQVSVSGIIQKYFCDYEEVTLRSSFTSKESKIQHKEQWMTDPNDEVFPVEVSANPPFTPLTPPRVLVFPLPVDVSSKTLREKFKRNEVGKRLIVASDKLGISSSSKKHKSGRPFLVSKSSSLVKTVVFEISDSDD